MDRILITGGAGFVGSSLALQWKNTYPQATVVALDNLHRRGSESNVPRLSQAGVQFVHGDIRSKDDVFGLSGNFDLVIDAAAEPSVLAGMGDGGPSYLLETNLNGTLNCLEFARRRSAGFVFLSTSRVYAIADLAGLPFQEKTRRLDISPGCTVPGAGPQGIREDFTTAGYRSLYGASKLAAELLVQEYVHAFGLPAVINRCGVICGPGQFGKADQGVFTFWLAAHLLGKPLRYTGFGGTGKQVRDLLHPADLFSLVKTQVGDLKKYSGSLFNVGGGLEGSVSLAEWTQACQEASGKNTEIASVPQAHRVDIAYYVSDNTRVTTQTGWRPQIRPAQIAREIALWLGENPELARTLVS